MEKIQEILFENKESIPNGIYIELMNELKKSYITKNENELIKITYTRIRPTFEKIDSEEYRIVLIRTNNLTVIVKKSDFDFDDFDKIKAIPFIPFFARTNSNMFYDNGYRNEMKTIFKKIKKEEDNDDESDDWDFDCDNSECNKRKIAISLDLNYDIDYLITNVEKI